MEKILSKVVTVGVPYGVLQFVRKASGHKGGASFTTGLSSLGGRWGMNGGIFALGLVGVTAGYITEQTTYALLNGVVKQLCVEGESQEEVFAKIDKYPVSKELKLKLKETVRQYNSLSIEQ